MVFITSSVVYQIKNLEITFFTPGGHAGPVAEEALRRVVPLQHIAVPEYRRFRYGKSRTREQYRERERESVCIVKRERERE